MPFRIPYSYKDIAVCTADPTEGQLRAYLLWLAWEREQAEAALRLMVKGKEA